MVECRIAEFRVALPPCKRSSLWKFRRFLSAAYRKLGYNFCAYRSQMGNCCVSLILGVAVREWE